MKQSQLIAKNMTVILVSEMIGFGLQLAVTVLVARHLGAEGFGKYSFILAFVWVFQLIADSGLSNIMVREISVRKETLEYQLGVTKSLIWMLSLVVFALIALTANIFSLDTTVKNAVYIMGLAVIATVHAVGYSSIFRAMEEMEYNAIGFVAHKVLLLTLTISVIMYGYGIIAIITVNLICNVALWCFYYMVVRLRYHRPKMIIDISAWRYLIVEAIPIGIASILRKISLQVDILILTALATTASVGLFSAPYKIIQALTLLPQTLTIALFPLFSRLAKRSYRELFAAYEKNLKFIYLLSIPVVVVLTILARSIMAVVFGPAFIPASIALQLLSVSIIFLFQTSQFVYLFSALGKQRLFTVTSFVALAVNVILDFLLIPKFDFMGACMGTLAAEVSLFCVGVCFIKAVDKNTSFLRASWKAAVSGCFMATVLYPFRDSSLSLALLGIVLSLLVYLLSLFILRFFSSSELSKIIESFLFLKKKSSSLESVQGSEAKS
jgi:O-antigen/teichoic acid export membrane protein